MPGDQGLTGVELFPNVAAEICAVLADCEKDLSQTIALRASAWMGRAASTLPAMWRENYLGRAPAREVLPTTPRRLQAS